MKRCSLTLVVFTGCAVVGFIRPLWAGEDTLSINERVELLAEKFDRYRQHVHIPGLALAVVKDDKVILARGFGMSDLDARRPVTHDTVFGIASTSKAFTTGLLAMLVGEEKLSWSDRVRDRLPGFHLRDKRLEKRVRLIDLVSHRTGYTRMGFVFVAGQAGFPLMLEAIGRAEPYANYRQQFLYTNIMFGVAGEVARTATGDDWHDLVRTRIFEPLGMHSTSTRHQDLLADANRALGYAWNGTTETFERVSSVSIDSCAPAGSINSSVRDLASWLRLLLRRGEIDGRQLIPSDQFDELWKFRIMDGVGGGYALGWFVGSWRDRLVVQHGGNLPGFAAQIGLLPEENLGFVMLCNVSMSSLQASSLDLVWETLLGDEEEARRLPTPGPRPGPQERRELLGAHSLFAGLEMEVIEWNGGLALSIREQGIIPLDWPDDQGRWRMAGGSWPTHVRFEWPGPELVFHQAGIDLILDRLQPLADDCPVPLDELLDRVGRYYATTSWREPPSLSIRGKVDFVHQGVSGTFHVLAEGTDRWRETMDLGPFGSTVTVVAGDRGWSEELGKPRRELTEVERDMILLQHPARWFMDWRRIYRTIEFLKVEEIDGVEAIVLRVQRANGPAQRIAVEPESGRLLQEDLWIPSVIMTAAIPRRFSDERPLEGRGGAVVIPFAREAEHSGMGKWIQQAEEIQVGAAIPPEAFQIEAPAAKTVPR